MNLKLSFPVVLDPLVHAPKRVRLSHESLDPPVTDKSFIQIPGSKCVFSPSFIVKFLPFTCETRNVRLCLNVRILTNEVNENQFSLVYEIAKYKNSRLQFGSISELFLQKCPVTLFSLRESRNVFVLFGSDPQRTPGRNYEITAVRRLQRSFIKKIV